jgi:hypothetical protein
MGLSGIQMDRFVLQPDLIREGLRLQGAAGMSQAVKWEC